MDELKDGQATKNSAGESPWVKPEQVIAVTDAVTLEMFEATRDAHSH